MMYKKNCSNLFFVICLLVFSHCFEPDGSVPFLPSEKFTLDITNYESTMALINFDHLELSFKKRENNWHLEFSNEKGNWRVLTNPCFKIKIAKTSLISFNRLSLNDISSLENWQSDATFDGDILSAFGNWGDFSFENPKSYQMVYVISIEEQNFTKFYKVQFLDTENENYILYISDFTPNQMKRLVIEKRDNPNLICLNLDRPSDIIYIPLPSHHLRFSILRDSMRHVDYFSLKNFDNEMGVFPSIFLFQSQVATISDIDFDSIHFINIQSLKFQEKEVINIHPEKISNSIFRPSSEKYYIFSTPSGYYKIRFNTIRFPIKYYIRWEFEIKRI